MIVKWAREDGKTITYTDVSRIFTINGKIFIVRKGDENQTLDMTQMNFEVVDS